jgi:hypothetical protein
VNELGRTGGRAAGQIVLLEQHNRRPPASRIAGDSAAIHPAPDHRKIEASVLWLRQAQAPFRSFPTRLRRIFCDSHL